MKCIFPLLLVLWQRVLVGGVCCRVLWRVWQGRPGNDWANSGPAGGEKRSVVDAIHLSARLRRRVSGGLMGVNDG